MENMLDWLEQSLSRTAPGFDSSAPAGNGVVWSLDYDGTLAPAGMPHSTTEPHPGVNAALKRLIGSGSEVWLTSGKDINGLRELLPIEGVKYCGLFGLEYDDGTGVRYHPDVKEQHHEAIAAVYETLNNQFNGERFPGIEIEHQGSLLTVDTSHSMSYQRMLVTTLVWKGCDDDFDHERATASVKAIALEHGLEVNVGHGYVNVVPFLPGKGVAVRQIITNAADRELENGEEVFTPKTLVCVGDEAPDLASFREAETLLAEGMLSAFVNLGVSQPVYQKEKKDVTQWGPKTDANVPRPTKERKVFLETGTHGVDPAIEMSEVHLSDGHMVLPGPRGVAQFLTKAAGRLEQPFDSHKRLTLPVSVTPIPLGRAL